MTACSFVRAERGPKKSSGLGANALALRAAAGIAERPDDRPRRSQKRRPTPETHGQSDDRRCVECHSALTLRGIDRKGECSSSYLEEHMKILRPSVAVIATVGLLAAACGGAATPVASPSTSSQASAAVTTRKLVIGFTASQTGAQNLPSKKQTEGILSLIHISEPTRLL